MGGEYITWGLSTTFWFLEIFVKLIFNQQCMHMVFLFCCCYCYFFFVFSFRSNGPVNLKLILDWLSKICYRIMWNLQNTVNCELLTNWNRCTTCFILLKCFASSWISFGYPGYNYVEWKPNCLFCRPTCEHQNAISWIKLKQNIFRKKSSYSLYSHMILKQQLNNKCVN